MICLKIKEILDKAYGDDIITNVTYVTELLHMLRVYYITQQSHVKAIIPTFSHHITSISSLFLQNFTINCYKNITFIN